MKKLNIRTDEESLTPEMAHYAHECYQQFIKEIRYHRCEYHFGEISTQKKARTYGTMYFNAHVTLLKTGSISVMVNNENKDG